MTKRLSRAEPVVKVHRLYWQAVRLAFFAALAAVLLVWALALISERENLPKLTPRSAISLVLDTAAAGQPHMTTLSITPGAAGDRSISDSQVLQIREAPVSGGIEPYSGTFIDSVVVGVTSDLSNSVEKCGTAHRIDARDLRRYLTTLEFGAEKMEFFSIALKPEGGVPSNALSESTWTCDLPRDLTSGHRHELTYYRAPALSIVYRSEAGPGDAGSNLCVVAAAPNARGVDRILGADPGYVADSSKTALPISFNEKTDYTWLSCEATQTVTFQAGGRFVKDGYLVRQASVGATYIDDGRQLGLNRKTLAAGTLFGLAGGFASMFLDQVVRLAIAAARSRDEAEEIEGDLA